MLRPLPLPLATTERLLVAGGDGRIAVDKVSGVNRYGCSALPNPELLSYASATATTISPDAYAAADALRTQIQQELLQHPAESVHTKQLQRLRAELLTLCGLEVLPVPEVVFAASGTDLHHIATQLAVAAGRQGLTVLMVDQEETGSGVFASITYADPAIQVITVALREEDGTARHTAEIDAEFLNLACQANAQGQQVLLIQTDVSKTGMIAPSYACSAKMSQMLGEHLDVLIDACQFRISTTTLQACLAQGYNVALTGSKFVGGPSFSGALLIPEQNATRIRERYARAIPAMTATQAEDIWQARYTEIGSWGMVLRWEAALHELRALRRIAEANVELYLQRFANAIQQRLREDSVFEPVISPTLTRLGLHNTQGWDNVQSIHTFRVRGPDNRLLDATQITQLYQSLPHAMLPCQLAQPVACGRSKDALRLCLSAPQLVAACRNPAEAERILMQAQLVLDQVAALAQHMPGTALPHNALHNETNLHHTMQRRVAHG